MAQATKGEVLHAKGMQYMQQHLLRREDMQGVTAKTVNAIARVAKRHLENPSS